VGGRPSRIGDAVYRTLLRALPARVRAADADDMVDQFGAERAARRGHPLRLARLWLAAAADVLWSALLARLAVPRRLSPSSRRRTKGAGTMVSDDIRHAVRRLRSRPATAPAAGGMLALAIGLTTAMFTIVDALVLRPVPFPHAERLARMVMFSSAGGRYAVSLGAFSAWRESPAFDAVEAFDTGTSLVQTDGGLIAREGAFVTTGVFDMLGARAIRGRLFAAGDGRAGADLEQTARPRAAAALALAFAAIAVLAAAGGLFSILSDAVGRRQREFGIRLALGARPAEVRRLIVGDGLQVASAGVVVSAAAGWWLAQSLASMTYGVAPGEPATWITVVAVVLLTRLLASWRPAARAGRVDPVALLREE
jgi:hypothetical protein